MDWSTWTDGLILAGGIGVAVLAAAGLEAGVDNVRRVVARWWRGER